MASVNIKGNFFVFVGTIPEYWLFPSYNFFSFEYVFIIVNHKITSPTSNSTENKKAFFFILKTRKLLDIYFLAFICTLSDILPHKISHFFFLSNVRLFFLRYEMKRFTKRRRKKLSRNSSYCRIKKIFQLPSMARLTLDLSTSLHLFWMF